MEYTLLDAIKSTSWVCSETGLIKYQSLPQGVKELSCRRDFLFLKQWWIVFEGVFDLSKLEAICKVNNYSLITEEPVKSFSPTKGEDCRGTPFEKIAQETETLFDSAKPDRRYYVCRGHKEFVCINWYGHNKELYFSTSQRKGLKFAEDYRRSLLNL